MPAQVRPLGRGPAGAAGRDPAAGAVQSNRRQLARPVRHCGSGRRRMAGARQAGGDGGDQRGGQQPHPAAAGSHLADLRREEGRAPAHEGPAGRPEENRGGAMGRRRTTAARSTATGCGKSSKGSCRGPQIPRRRRRSAAPVNGGRGKHPLKGYTEDHLREAWWRYLDRKTPSETAKAAKASRHHGTGSEANARVSGAHASGPDQTAAQPGPRTRPKRAAAPQNGAATRRKAPDPSTEDASPPRRRTGGGVSPWISSRPSPP